ncbi:hypothetical protein Trydic_g17034 [Trypoxylus dichotomus]
MFNFSDQSIYTARQIHFSWYDYCLFLVMLGSSVAIGIYFGCFGKKQNSAKEYLLGGKTMKVVPIAISLVASHVSGVTVLAIPADVYKFGSNYGLVFISIALTNLLAAYVTMPIFHKLQITSTYEYLQMRFDSKTRLMASLLFSIATLLYLPIVIYGPALALAQVTPINLHLINPIICAICIFYTTIGGLKAVVWTDTLQFGAMLGAIVAVLFLGISVVGGLGTVFNRSREGGRFDIDFDLDPTKRDSFWAVVIGWTMNWIPHVAINQGAVQKCLSLPTLNDVKIAMLLFGIGTVFCKAASVLTGLIMYATYHDCDPFLLNRVHKNDQLLPYYIMDVANQIPGLSGLFIAGVFCAGLSTLSAQMNSFSGIIYQDFVSRFMPRDISDEKVSNMLRLIVVVVGIISTTLVLVVEHLGGILALSIAFSGITSGPLLGLFTMGMIFPFANSKGALIGSVCSLLIGCGIMVGNRIYQAAGILTYIPKPTSIEGCVANVTNIASNTTIPNGGQYVFILFRVSHYYYTLIGMFVVLAVGLPISWFTGKEKDVNKELITPWMHWAIPKTSTEKLPVYDLGMKEELKKLYASN